MVQQQTEDQVRRKEELSDEVQDCEGRTRTAGYVESASLALKYALLPKAHHFLFVLFAPRAGRCALAELQLLLGLSVDTLGFAECH
jgi:hypothetical protein